MKPAFASIARRATWLLGTALFFAQQSAVACPGCKQATEGRNTPLNGASIGFSLSIFVLLFVLFTVLGGLGWMMYRSCQALAARDRALALLDDGDGSPTASRA